MNLRVSHGWCWAFLPLKNVHIVHDKFKFVAHLDYLWQKAAKVSNSFLCKKKPALPKCQLTTVWKNKCSVNWRANINLSGSQWREKGEMRFLLRPQGERAVFKMTFHFSFFHVRLVREKKEKVRLGWWCFSLNVLNFPFTYRDKIIWLT